MNLLDDAINRAKCKSEKGRERRKCNFYNSPANSDKLIRVYATKFRECEFGEPPPVTKKVKGMLSGFIKVCRSSGWVERRIYETVELLVEHWEYVKRCDHHTLNGKKAALGDRPSLLEFLICRETMITAIDKAMRQTIVEDTNERKSIQVTSGKRFTPTEEEMQEEYNKLMEDF
jgi:uncharacterized protein YifE (UPF0438 family)